MSLKKAVEEFFELVDHKHVEVAGGQTIDAGGGYSQEQYDAALKKIRDEAGIEDPLAPGAEPKESDEK